MITKPFGNSQLPLLSFGAMRLPTKENGQIDEGKVEEMVAYAMAHGVNYFDTAHPYHEGMSEVVMGRVLSHYPRESYYLATKYPGHQLAERYDVAAVFEEQLKKCGVDYFDFYLLHNVCETSLDTYLDPKWNIIPYLLEQKKQGRIRHLGFSTHGLLPNMKAFLEIWGHEMEFCQIQLNYLDWTLQKGKEKYELLKAYHIPVWVMEPVRGGALARLTSEQAKVLTDMRPHESVVSWAFRFLMGLDEVKVILSGMSNIDQVKQNISTFETNAPLSEEETAQLLAMAESLKSSIPCTACGYCKDKCPMKLDIPMFLATWNDIRVFPSLNAAIRVELLPESQKPDVCVGCGACTRICPQKIDIPTELARFAEKLEAMPKWADISKAREEKAKQMRTQS